MSAERICSKITPAQGSYDRATEGAVRRYLEAGQSRPAVPLFCGDPRLHAREEGFLTDLTPLLRTYRGKVGLTAKQWAWLNQILDKMEQDTPEETFTDDDC